MKNIVLEELILNIYRWQLKTVLRSKKKNLIAYKYKNNIFGYEYVLEIIQS